MPLGNMNSAMSNRSFSCISFLVQRNNMTCNRLINRSYCCFNVPRAGLEPARP
jgi:hypothetical protein